MAETQHHQHQGREEVKIEQVTKFLQSLGAVLTENRDILTILPEIIHKRVVELEANIAQRTKAVTSDKTGDLSGKIATDREKGETLTGTHQEEIEKKITLLKEELNDANKKIKDLEAKNQQNDSDVEMLKGENRTQGDKTDHYKSKYNDLKAKLRTANEDLKAKREKIAELGREMHSKQEDYDKETKHNRQELAEKEKTLVEMKDELHRIKEEHNKTSRDQKARINELEASVTELGRQLGFKQEDFVEETQLHSLELAKKDKSIAELERKLLSKQEDYDKETKRKEQKIAEKEKTLHKEKLERERAKQHYVHELRDKETKIKGLQASNKDLTHQLEEQRIRNESLNAEVDSNKKELRHYVERFRHQEEKYKSDLSIKEMEINKTKQRLSLREKEMKSLNDEVQQYKSRLATICEKRVRQDQRSVENILALNQPSEVERDFREFFDSDREDARDIIQSSYESEEEVDVHFYYPRIACTIFVAAYEIAVNIKEAVIDLFKEASKKMILQGPEIGRKFDLIRKDEAFVFYPISIDACDKSEKSTDVLDTLMNSLKESAHMCNLQCLEEDVSEAAWAKWNEWYVEDTSFVHTPSREVLTKLSGYTKACIRLAWRMVTQLPPLRLEYHSSSFDYHIHKKMARQVTFKASPVNGEASTEEIAYYLWPGLFDGGVRLIRPGLVLCKM